MTHFMINVLVIQKRAELGRSGTVDMMKTQFLFHSQFVLDYDRYRDNNNYVRHNMFQF